MCGVCGDDRMDWAVSVLGGAYARAVVARLLSAVMVHTNRKATVVPGPAGWMLTVSGRPAVLHRRFDDLIDAIQRNAILPRDAVRAALDAQAAHRPLTVPPRSVPASRRVDRDETTAKRDGSGVEADSVRGESDRLIHRILFAALNARDVGGGGPVEVEGPGGRWTLLTAAPLG